MVIGDRCRQRLKLEVAEIRVIMIRDSFTALRDWVTRSLAHSQFNFVQKVKQNKLVVVAVSITASFARIVKSSCLLADRKEGFDGN